MSECAQLEDFDEQLYKVRPLHRMRFWRTLRVRLAVYSRDGWQVSGEGEEKYLIATSEQTLCSMLRHKWIDPKACPMRLAGYSTCFRKEVRSHPNA